MKRVLVTGSCGNIGANVVDLLVQRGYQVRGIDLDNKKNRQTAARWGARVDMCFGSVCNEAVVADVVSGMDHVIHLAAIVPPVTDVDQAIESLANARMEYGAKIHSAKWVMTELHGLGYHGVAICDHRDDFSRKRGRIIAKGRLLKYLKQSRPPELIDGTKW